eukprot:3475316-Alexandrium_andersonii.AAC.1
MQLNARGVLPVERTIDVPPEVWQVLAVMPQLAEEDSEVVRDVVGIIDVEVEEAFHASDTESAMHAVLPGDLLL